MESLPMDPWVPPLLNTLKFDYEAGSIVKVKTRNGKIFRGEVFQNPSRTGMPNSITLINIIDEGCSKPVSGFLTLFQHEILSVTGIQAAPETVKKPRETIMATYMVTTMKQLNNAISVMEEVKEIGCYVPGTGCGRFGSPKYVILNVRNVLVVIPMENFEEDRENLWETLGARLFGNANTMKIFFDSRGIADYLYHKRNTVLTNIFDLRVTELFIRKKLEVSPWCGCKNSGGEAQISLTSLLEKYMSQAVPSCDIRALENTSSTTSDPTLKKFYALKVKYLLTLQEEQTKLLLLPLENAVSRLCRKTIGENAVAFLTE